jgi:hypothetical protein
MPSNKTFWEQLIAYFNFMKHTERTEDEKKKEVDTKRHIRPLRSNDKFNDEATS